MINITISKKFTGELVAIPKKEYQSFNVFLSFIDRDQLFFWTKEWQKKEKEVDNEIKSGKVGKVYDNTKDLRRALSLMKK